MPSPSGCVTRTYWKSEIPSGSELRLFVSLKPSPSKAPCAKRRGSSFLDGQGAPEVREMLTTPHHGTAVQQRLPVRTRCTSGAVKQMVSFQLLEVRKFDDSPLLTWNSWIKLHLLFVKLSHLNGNIKINLKHLLIVNSLEILELHQITHVNILVFFTFSLPVRALSFQFLTK